MRFGYWKGAVACVVVATGLVSGGAQAGWHSVQAVTEPEPVEAEQTAAEPQLSVIVGTTESTDAEAVLAHGGTDEIAADADHTGLESVAAESMAAGTVVYIIREKSFVGGGRSVWIAANDRVVAALSNGSHVRLTLEQAVNSINAVQGKAGFAYMAVDERAGETIYARIDYIKGSITEIPTEEGLALVAKTKTIEVLEELRPNDAYDNLLVNPELLGLGLVETQVEPIAADQDSAVITFYRPGKLIEQVPFSFWSQDGYAATLYGKQYVQLRVAPGSHRFVGFSERLSVLEMNVEANKEYVVELDVGMGWNQAHIKLLPVDVSTSAARIDGWKLASRLVGINAQALASEKAAARVAAGFAYLQENQERWLSEEAVRRSNSGSGTN